MNKLYQWLVRLPHMVIKYRNETQWFIVREVFHFAGGAALGGTATLIGLIHPYVAIWSYAVIGGLMTGTVFWLETRDYKSGQTKFKTAMDLLSWSSGFLLVLLICL